MESQRSQPDIRSHFGSSHFGRRLKVILCPGQSWPPRAGRGAGPERRSGVHWGPERWAGSRSRTSSQGTRPPPTCRSSPARCAWRSFDDPVQLACTHIFCESCVAPYEACPTCHERLDGVPARGQPLHECNKPMYRMMSRIKVRCPYHEGGASGDAARVGAARAGDSEAAHSSGGEGTWHWPGSTFGEGTPLEAAEGPKRKRCRRDADGDGAVSADAEAEESASCPWTGEHGEFREPGLWYLSEQFHRGFVVSANLRNTCWSFYMGKLQSAQKASTKTAQTEKHQNPCSRNSPGEYGDLLAHHLRVCELHAVECPKGFMHMNMNMNVISNTRSFLEG